MRKAHIVILLFTVMLSNKLEAQNTRRGFKLLEKADYEKSADLFTETLSENPLNPAALFGLTLIYADEKSAFIDLVKSWEYGSSLDSLIDKFTTEDLEYIGEYFYNTEERHISRPVKKKIEYAVETIEAKLIKYIREENNLELVYRVLERFPDFRHYDNVIHIRNQLEFRKYEKLNTIQAYREFLEKFPDAAQIEKARRYINRLAFENAIRINSVESYKAYLKEYPDAIESNSAIKRLHAVAFEMARKENTVQALDNFMTEYPEALEIYEAKQIQKQLLYEYAKKIQTLEAYNEFIRKYPEGQQYIDIFNLKSMDNGMHFLAANPLSSNNIQWSRSFDEENNEELTSCLAVDTLNNYILGSTVFRSDTGFTDAWIIKLGNDGKMLWNKYIGEAFNDEVNLLAVTNRNEILGAGYTWTGTDSASRECWLFKLGPDGSKLWTRKLGKMHICSLSATKDGNILAGGYLINDSLQSLYSVAVLNDQGKKLWARTYTGKGSIISMVELTDGNLLLAGTGWSAKINSRGYLQWENSFESNTLLACLLTGNRINYMLLRDSVSVVLISRDINNKIIAEKELEIPQVHLKMNSLAGNADRLIALLSFEDHQSINWIDLKSGKINASRLPAGAVFSVLKTDRQNNLLLQSCSVGLILIKNTGLTF